MVRAYVGLGGNLGDVPGAIARALDALDALPHTRLITRSSLYRNPALMTRDGVSAPQPDYVNAVAAVDTALAPLALLDHLLAIERDEGRERGVQRWASRTLDLDLLLYGDEIRDDARLTLPHPGAHLRAFVVHPLAEIDAAVRIPGHGTAAELCARVSGAELVRMPRDA